MPDGVFEKFGRKIDIAAAVPPRLRPQSPVRVAPPAKPPALAGANKLRGAGAAPLQRPVKRIGAKPALGPLQVRDDLKAQAGEDRIIVSLINAQGETVRRLTVHPDAVAKLKIPPGFHITATAKSASGQVLDQKRSARGGTLAMRGLDDDDRRRRRGDGQGKPASSQDVIEDMKAEKRLAREGVLPIEPSRRNWIGGRLAPIGGRLPRHNWD